MRSDIKNQQKSRKITLKMVKNARIAKKKRSKSSKNSSKTLKTTRKRGFQTTVWSNQLHTDDILNQIQSNNFFCSRLFISNDFILLIIIFRRLSSIDDWLLYVYFVVNAK